MISFLFTQVSPSWYKPVKGRGYMTVDHVFVSGNRAIISSYPGVPKLDGNPLAISGLVLHGSASCFEYARAFIDACSDYERSANRGNRIFFKRYPEHRFFVADENLVLTLISPIGKSPLRSTLTITGIVGWYDMAAHLVKAADMIKDHEKNCKVPICSPWKSTSGTSLQPVRL